MNERIKELEIQCWEPRQYGPAWFNSTKFAELIVRECANAIINDSRLNDVRSAANGCVRTINEHFGVG